MDILVIKMSLINFCFFLRISHWRADIPKVSRNFRLNALGDIFNLSINS